MEILENFNFPEIIINKIMTYLSHPVADLFNEYSCCLQQKIKDVPELRFYRVFFYTKRYPILYEYLKLPNKQIYDIF
jgi:hypothetical protein